MEAFRSPKHGLDPANSARLKVCLRSRPRLTQPPDLVYLISIVCKHDLRNV